MAIPEHKIEELLERIDMVGLVGRHVELKKVGRSWRGRCPFHEEKTPSFYVTPELKTFKCFGCQAGGDAISFVQKYEGKGFVDAVKELAKEVGMELSVAEDPAAAQRQKLREVTDFAQRHFQARLWEPTEAGRAAVAYLADRGIQPEAIKAFGLGLCGSGWDDLSNALKAQGTLEWALAVGLVHKRKSGSGHYDAFRGRLMIPIRSPEGRCIAFGGRLLGGGSSEGPKYLNSPQSPLYNKSEILFGMDVAKEEIRKRRAAVLVEGYFDCLMLHQVGVRHAVAICSTALTPGQLLALKRAEASELTLLLDGDAAGQKAVERLAGLLLSQGSSAKVACLPEGEDPDTFARRQGPSGVQALLDSAKPLSMHLMESLLPQGRLASFEMKMEAIQRLRPICAELPPGLARSAFFGTLSQHFGIAARELEEVLRGKAATLAQRPKESPAPPPRAAPPPARRMDPLEAFWAAAAMKQPELLQGEGLEGAAHPGIRSLLARLAEGVPPVELLEEASEPVRRALSEASARLPEPGEALADTFWAIGKKLRLRRIEEQLSHIAKVTGQIALAGELTEETRRLQAERMELLALRRKIVAEVRPPLPPALKSTQKPA
jgi:DNA primase